MRERERERGRRKQNRVFRKEKKRGNRGVMEKSKTLNVIGSSITLKRTPSLQPPPPKLGFIHGASLGSLSFTWLQ